MKIILGPVDLVVGKSSRVREKIPPSITCLGREAKIQTSLHCNSVMAAKYPARASCGGGGRKIEEEDGKSGMIHKSPSSWHFSPLSQFSFFYTEQDVVCLLLME